MNLRETLKIEGNDLIIGGVKAKDLARKYGTPLYVMDVAFIRSMIRAYKKVVEEEYGSGHVAYASKAFSSKAVYAIMKSENAYIDVVSGGEIYTALSAGFDIKNAYFHGNNKLISELELALDNGIGNIVIDNLEEIEIVNRLARDRGIVQPVLIRSNPGVEAHTHTFIQTAKVDSKFGFNIATGDAMEAIKLIAVSENLAFKGIHYHIGSQIFDTNAFRLAINIGTDFIAAIKEQAGLTVEEFNIGGGYGVHYSGDDPKYSFEDYSNNMRIIAETLKNDIESKKIAKPRLVIEPGRSIVGEAGITLYSVGATKEIKGMVKYCFVDGGMGDNIRPALYQAEYEAIAANRASEPHATTYSIAGKFCESSDILIKGAKLPEVKRGDLIAVFTTGAYNYSMASNYNRNAIPPVVMAENGVSDYAVKPQTYEDIIRNDVIPSFIK